MPNIDFNTINYLAVIVAGLATFVLGGIWYSGLFGKLWIKYQGYTPEQVAEMKAKMSPVTFFGGMIVCYLVIAFVLAILFQHFDVRSAMYGAKVGLALWAIVAAVGMTSRIAECKPFAGFLIDAIYQLIFLIMMGAIIGGWPK